jgi:hypothetical protein
MMSRKLSGKNPGKATRFNYYTHEALAKVSNVHHPQPLPSREGTHPYTPLKRGFTLSPGGLWLGANGSKRRGWG